MAEGTASDPTSVVAQAPGRVVLMGDHTDQTGGRVLPMAVDLGTTIRGHRRGTRVRLRSTWAGVDDVVDLPLDGRGATGWGRLAGAVAALVRPSTGFDGLVESTLPVGGGLSSSASFTVAVALALGFDGTAAELAELGQAAEQAATGVPCGRMDQLASALGVAGHALRIDCHTGAVAPVPLPPDLDVVVVHSGQPRSLADTAYDARVAELRAAEATVGPLRSASAASLDAIEDPTVRRRARHVVTENARVDATATALRSGDRAALASLLAESHASLRDDFEVSTPVVEELVAALAADPAVVGARLTGAGFGGCVVALVEAGAPLPHERTAWRVRPAGGATCAAGGRPSWPRTRRR